MSCRILVGREAFRCSAAKAVGWGLQRGSAETGASRSTLALVALEVVMKAPWTIGLSCAMLLPLVAEAQQCAREARVIQPVTVPQVSGMAGAEYEFRVKGPGAMDPAALAKKYDLRTATLQVEYGARRLAWLRLAQHRINADGSLCIDWEPWKDLNSRGGHVTKVAGATGGSVSTCISREGLVTSSLKVTSDVNYQPVFSISISPLLENGQEIDQELILIEADLHSCS